MIFFYCPECREELEAEDSIRGTRMKCPACFKEIEIPQASVKLPFRTSRSEAPVPSESEEVLPGTRFILVVLVAGLVGLLVISGVGYTLLRRAQERARAAQPACGACEGKGRVTCAVCTGTRRLPCTECSGTGKRRNVRDQEETCYKCSGAGTLECSVCGGRGEYGCTGCGGSGRLSPPDASR
ncbi:MAG: hypothetical protein ACK44W_09375 [Planctomycetota bacterium]